MKNGKTWKNEQAEGCFGGKSHKKKKRLYFDKENSKKYKYVEVGYSDKGTAGHKLWKKFKLQSC